MADDDGGGDRDVEMDEDLEEDQRTQISEQQLQGDGRMQILNEDVLDGTQPDASYNESKLIPACLPTPNPSSHNFTSRFRADVVQLVETSNIHKHSDTCYKYWNASRGEKKSCRIRMPRKLVPVSTIDPDTGHISMRRSDPMINNFNECLIAACRSNMD
ncbi:unnamed protein product, partial [Rotaria sp. Silwood2]